METKKVKAFLEGLDVDGYVLLSCGIDPGKKTGLAVVGWRGRPLRPHVVGLTTVQLHEAMSICEGLLRLDKPLIFAFEDAREREFFGAEERRLYEAIRRGQVHKLSRYKGMVMGAGSVRRDSAIWAEFLATTGVPYVHVVPGFVRTKVREGDVRDMGWEGPSSEHSRDALMLARSMALLQCYQSSVGGARHRRHYLGSVSKKTRKMLIEERQKRGT